MTQFDDDIFENLLVQEQVELTAKMAGMPNPAERTTKILEHLGIGHVAGVKIGGGHDKGVSGGEKKRVNIANQLITDPSVAFLDEPTTGLDSKSSLDIALIIELICNNRRTAVTTIHQPSYEILSKFTKIIFLVKGKIVYQGPPDQIAPYFSNLGLPPPPQTNPADHLMIIMDPDSIKKEAIEKGKPLTKKEINAKFKERLETCVLTYKCSWMHAKVKEDMKKDHEAYLQNKDNQEATGSKGKDRGANFFVVLFILYYRAYKLLLRDPYGLLMKLFQAILNSLCVCGAFFNMAEYSEDTRTAIQDRLGFYFMMVFFAIASQIIFSLEGILPHIAKLSDETERKLYNPAVFFFVTTTHQIPYMIFVYIVLMIPITFLVDVDGGTAKVNFLIHGVTFYLAGFSGGGLGEILSVLSSSVSEATSAATFIVVPISLLSGYFVGFFDLNIAYQILSYLSPYKYGFQAAVSTEWSDSDTTNLRSICKVRVGDCTDFDCATPIPTTSALNDACNPYFNAGDYYENHFTYNWILLIVVGILFRFIAAGILWWRFSPGQMKKVDSGNKNKGQTDTEVEEMSKMKADLNENFVTVHLPVSKAKVETYHVNNNENTNLNNRDKKL